MSKQVLKDNRGNILGTIEADSNGKLIAKDNRMNKVGDYDPKTNVTKDSRGNRVGQGNLLSGLITSFH